MGNKIALLISSVFVLFGCATEQKKMEPSQHLMTTNLSSEKVLKKIRAKLEANKYQVRTYDENSGLILTEPRRFSYERGGEKVYGRQTLQIRQEGGSIKFRIQYHCDYGSGVFGFCWSDDNGIRNKAKKIEATLLNDIRPVLLKNSEHEAGAAAESNTPPAAETGEAPADGASSDSGEGASSDPANQ